MVCLLSRHSHLVYPHDVRWERTLDNHLQGCEAACADSRYLPGEVVEIRRDGRGMWVSNISEEKNVPIKENNSVPLTRTLCDSTQPVACIRGYEPFVRNSSWLPWKVPPELHFRQHKHNCHTLLYAAVIMTMQQYQFDVTCKITCIWRHSNSAAGPR